MSLNFPQITAADSQGLAGDANLQLSIVPDGVNYAAFNRSTSAAFLICIGQSNGSGTQLLPVDEEINSLPNVYFLAASTAVAGSKWTDESTWGWSNFTSDASELNLVGGSGHRKTFTTEVAREWQARIDAGENLPDLYLCHMSRGANGFGDSSPSTARYNPNYFIGDRTSLWRGPLKLHSWALRNLLKTKASIVHLGLNNNQWEHDGREEVDIDAYLGYMQALLAEHDKVAGFKIPFSYFVPGTAGADGRYSGYQTVSANLAKISDRKVTALDVTELDTYDTSLTKRPGFYGVYHDGVHYPLDTFDALEQQFWDKAGHNGLLMTSLPAGSSTAEPMSLPDDVVRDADLAARLSKTEFRANEFRVGAEFDFPSVTRIIGNQLTQAFEIERSEDGVKRFRIRGTPAQTYELWLLSGIPTDTISGSLIIKNIQAGTPLHYHAVFCANDTNSPTMRATGKDYITIGISANTQQIGSAYISHWNFDDGPTKISNFKLQKSDPAWVPLGFGDQAGLRTNTDIKISLLPDGNQYKGRVEWRETNADGSNPWQQIASDLDVTIADGLNGGGLLGLIFGLGTAAQPEVQNALRFAAFEFASLE